MLVGVDEAFVVEVATEDDLLVLVVLTVLVLVVLTVLLDVPGRHWLSIFKKKDSERSRYDSE